MLGRPARSGGARVTPTARKERPDVERHRSRPAGEGNTIDAGSYPRQAHLRGLQAAGKRHDARLVRRHRDGDPRSGRRALDRIGRAAERQARLLHVARVPDRPSAARRDRQSRSARGGRRGTARSRHRSRHRARRRARRGARQWRPRPSRRLLHGGDGERRRAGHRLRDPLRARAVPANDRTGLLAEGVARGLARRRQPLGISPPGVHLSDRLRRARRDHRARRRRHRALRVAARRVRFRGRLRHAGGRRGGAHDQHAPAVVGACERSAPARRFQPRRSCRRARRSRPLGSDLARALPERRHAGRTGAAAAAGVLLRFGLAAGHVAAPPARAAAISRASPTTSRSS